MKTRIFKYTLIFALAFSFPVFSGFVASSEFEVNKNLELFANIFKELNSFYVDDIDHEKLVTDGIESMLSSLDPYTVYYPEDDMEGFRLQTTGQYGGIGALIRKDEEYVIIAEPYEDFPAFKAGLIAGDRIIEINGKSSIGLNTDDVSNQLRGKPGTEVQIVIERPGTKEKLVKKLIREEVQIKSVPYYGMLENGIGYIRLSSFTTDCTGHVKKALLDLKSNHDLNGLVLDLRGNPGGLLEEAIELANLFVNKGTTIVNTEGREKEWRRSFKARKTGLDTDLPLSILVDRGSASASEIVSGVIQDYDRGIVVGGKTFGKGLVQSTRNIGYNTRVKITTAKYYLPSGRCVQAIDYNGKYKDGAEKIPDSLRTSYTTEAGRLVYDGGGIDPDIEIERERLSTITQELFTNQQFFGFATDFHRRNQSIGSAENFEISETTYNDFVKFVEAGGFDYTTSTERMLDRLEKTSEDELLHASIADDIAKIESKIKEGKRDDLQRNKEEVQEYLKREIVSRYHFQKGRIASSLKNDKAVQKAVEILSDPASYNQLLTSK